MSVHVCFLKAVVLMGLMLASALAAHAQSCSVTSTPLSFPSYNAFNGTAVNASATVRVTCSGLVLLGASYEARLGTGQSGNILNRKMAHITHGDELAYQVYLDTQQVWGNGTQGSTFSGVFVLGLFSRFRDHYITAQVPAGQQVRNGTYRDAPVITIIY